MTFTPGMMLSQAVGEKHGSTELSVKRAEDSRTDKVLTIHAASSTLDIGTPAVSFAGNTPKTGKERVGGSIIRGAVYACVDGVQERST